MFTGVNYISLDTKGRLAIPTKYRTELQERCDFKLKQTMYKDQCVLLYPLPEFEEIAYKIIKLPALDDHAQALRRWFIGHADDCEMDAQGRVLIVAPLRDRADLGKEVALVGQGNKFEIWSRKAWDHCCEESQALAIKGAEQLSPVLANLAL